MLSYLKLSGELILHYEKRLFSHHESALNYTTAPNRRVTKIQQQLLIIELLTNFNPHNQPIG